MSTVELVKAAWKGGEENTEAASPQAEWDFGAWTNPILGGPVVYVAGVVAYMTSVPWWWILLAGLLFGVSFIGAGLARGVKRLGLWFTLATSVVVTGWLIYAANVLTFNVLDWHATLMHVIAGAVVALPLMVVWGLLVRDAGRARVDAYMASQGRETARHRWEDLTASAGIKGWQVVGLRKNADAVTVTMRIAPGGTTYKQALSMTDALELACNAPFPGAVRLEQPRDTGVATVVIRQALRSTLAEVVPAPPVPAAPTSILDPLVDGRFDDGDLSGRVHAYQSVITLGQRDSGKTGLQNVRVDAYAQMKDCLLLAVDFKQGRFLRPWITPYATGQVDTPVFAGIGTSVTTVNTMLDGLLAIGDWRAAVGGGDKITPSPQLPAIRLEIDEAADLLSDPRYQPIAAKLIHVMRKLRSEGIDIDLASQRGTGSFLGQHSRDLLSQSTIVDLLRVDSAAEVYNALSISADKLGSVDPTVFEHPGTKLSLKPGARLAAARTFLLEPGDIPARAAAYAPWRPDLEPDAVRAADAATKGAFSKILRYETDEARAVLAVAADHAGVTHTWADEPVAAGAGEPAATPTPAASPTAASPVSSAASMRERFINEHGEVDGARMWDRARGRMALHAMRTLCGTNDHVLTRDVVAHLTATDDDMWGDINSKTLAALVADYGVEPIAIRAANNVRGYTREAIDASFEL